MKKVMLSILLTTIGVLGGCDVEETPGEAPIVGAELEEDATLVDDVPIGEPEVMDVNTGNPEPDAPAADSTGEVTIPPASEAVQPTPTLTDQ